MLEPVLQHDSHVQGLEFAPLCLQGQGGGLAHSTSQTDTYSFPTPSAIPPPAAAAAPPPPPPLPGSSLAEPTLPGGRRRATAGSPTPTPPRPQPQPSSASASVSRSTTPPPSQPPGSSQVQRLQVSELLRGLSQARSMSSGGGGGRASAGRHRERGPLITEMLARWGRGLWGPLITEMLARWVRGLWASHHGNAGQVGQGAMGIIIQGMGKRRYTQLLT